MAKLYKRYNLLIQLVILVVSYVFIINQVFWKHDLPALLRTLGDELGSARFLKVLFVVLIFMVLNWLLEALKWKKLIAKVEKVSLGQSVIAILTGITISSFTPNRVGEFFGRAFILEKASHIEGILITVIGSMSQLLVTILTGTLAWLVFLPVFMPGAGFISGYLYYAMIAVVLLLDGLLLLLFFNISFFSMFKEKILAKGLVRVRGYLRVFTLYSNAELLTVMALSFARYLVFSTQYILLLWAMGVDIPYYYAYLLIAMVYLIMALIPTIALTELGIRGSVAIYFFSFYFAQPMAVSAAIKPGILMASVLLWLINLGIPALAGSAFLFRLKFFRTSET